MSMVIIDLVYMILAAAAGAICSAVLFLRAYRRAERSSDASTAVAKVDSQEAVEVLGRLHDLATRVAVDVDEHSEQVQAINAEMTSAAAGETKTVIGLVARLVEANQQMQERLAKTEDKLREQAQKLETQAVESRTDALTLLANRRAFDSEMAQRLAELRRHGRSFSLMMVDVDRFKTFNDTHGHQAGDEILRGVARTLRRKMREMDVVARYGGEEFAAILPGTGIEEAKQAATRARESLEKARFTFEGTELKVTASLGVTEARTGDEASDVIQRADAALYSAKRGGRNCAYWHDGKQSFAVEPSQRPAKAKEKAAREEPARPVAEPQGERRDTAATPTERVSAGAPSGEPAWERTSGAALDAISNLPTRIMFCQHVRSRMAEFKRGGNPFSVILMEVDQYSEIMHHADVRACQLGMQAVTRFAQAAVREMDCLALYNPGCFAIMLPQAQVANSVQVAERLRQAVANFRLPLGNEPLRLTVSIGVVETAKPDDLISLLKRAEAALETARRKNGNCTYYNDGDHSGPVSELMQTVG